MKKSILLLITIIMVSMFSVTAFAAESKLGYESAYDADTNQVSVSVYVENPGALEAADFRLGYNESEYEFVETTNESTISDLMMVSGKAVTDTGLATCSVIFTEHCEDSYLVDGKLQLVTFVFTPVTEDYDINNFCFWVYSYEVDGSDISHSFASVGPTSLKNGKTDDVTVADYIDSVDNEDSDKSSSSGTKWYVYVIAVVLGIGVVAGVAIIAVKNNKDSEGEKDKKSEDESSEQNG